MSRHFGLVDSTFLPFESLQLERCVLQISNELFANDLFSHAPRLKTTGIRAGNQD